MSNFAQRLLLFLIGLPLLLGIVIYFDPYSHGGWAVVVVVVTYLAGRETLHLFSPSTPRFYLWIVPALSAAMPAAVYCALLLNSGFAALSAAMVAGVSFILIAELLRWKPEQTQKFTQNTTSLLTALIYPGFFMAFTIRFLEFAHPLAVIMLFLLVNFSNDTFAYLFGKVAGKNSPKLVPVSPKKTRIGFIGGFIGSIATGSVFFYFTPQIFAAELPLLIPYFLLIGLCADFGDLIESAYKRAAAKKDSGALMPGRGGLLDSIDSLLFSAPFFYYIGTILLK